MSDLIDRQAATSIPVMPKEERNYRTYNLDDAYDDGWNDALASVGQLPSAEPEWISVEERLPNDEDYHNFAQFPDGAVLWCTDKGIVGGGWYYESTKSWSCLDDTFPEEYGNVIAWMPLPKLYEGDME